MATERVFISYARRDGFDAARELRLRLEAAGVPVWQDLVALEGGRDWWSQIEDTIATPSLQHFVLVLTPGSLASSEVRREVRQARQEGKTVLPVRGPGVKDLSSLPRWMGHVYDLDLPHQFDSLVQVLRLPSQQKRVPMMAPEPPPDYVHRPAEFDPLKARLLDAKGDAVAITAALRGAGGYGKTTLAKKLANDPDIQNAYLDGVLWVELGEKPQNLLSMVSDLVTRLMGKPPQLETLNAAASALAEALGERRILLVIDDVWREQDLRPFLQGGPHTTRLVTTRVDATAPASAFRQKVDALEGAEAVKLLAAGLPEEEVAPLRGQFADLAARLGEWPLMLKLVNGFLRQRTTRMQETLGNALSGVVKRLEAKGLAAFDPRDEAERTRAVTRTIGVSLDMLDAASRDRFGELAVFPEDVDVPIDVAAAYWSVSGGLDSFETEDLLGYLEGLSLLLGVDMTRRTFRLHDTIRHFLRGQAGPARLIEMNRRLVDVLDGPDETPATSVYRYRRLLDHLAEAGEQGRIGALLLDPAWLTSKLAATSTPMALAEDYRIHGVTRMHDYIERTLRLCAGILARDPRQLVPQLIGRHARCQEEERDAFLSRLRAVAPSPSLVPATPSLTPPGAEAARLEGHHSWISALALLPGGRIASGGFDKKIRIWDTSSGSQVAHLLNLYGGGIRALGVLPGGRVVSGGEDSTVRIWDPASGVEVARLDGHEGNITALAILPDGRIASGSDDNTIRIWDAGSGAEVACLKGHGSWVIALAVLPDGRIVSGSYDNTIRIWDVKTGVETARLKGHSSWVSALAILPDGRIASGSEDKTIRIWDPGSGAEMARLEGHAGDVLALVALPDGRIVSGSEDRTIRVWDIATRAETAFLQGHGGGVTALAVLPDGRIASGSRDNTIRIWEAVSNEETARLPERQNRINALAVLPDGRVVAGSGDRSIRICDPDTGVEVGRLEGRSGNVIALVVLPDGRIVSGSDDNTVRVWDLASGAEPAKFEEQRSWLSSLAVLPDGRIVAGNYDASVRIWDKDAEIEPAALLGHRDAVRAIAVLPDGRIVSGSADKTIRIWDVVQGKEIARLEGHRNLVSALAVLPDGRIVSGSEDKTIRIWNASSGAELCRIELDDAVLALCCISPQRILAADAWGRLHWLELV